MKKRHVVNGHMSRSIFRHSASQNGVHPRNLVPMTMRGGIRL